MLEPNDLIAKFYNEEISKKYPDLPLSELLFICRAPFVFLKRQMERVTLPEIHFKYFGTFKVFNARVTNAIAGADKAKEQGKITEEKYNKIVQMVKLRQDEEK